MQVAGSLSKPLADLAGDFWPYPVRLPCRRSSRIVLNELGSLKASPSVYEALTALVYGPAPSGTHPSTPKSQVAGDVPPKPAALSNRSPTPISTGSATAATRTRDQPQWASRADPRGNQPDGSGLLAEAGAERSVGSLGNASASALNTLNSTGRSASTGSRRSAPGRQRPWFEPVEDRVARLDAPPIRDWESLLYYRSF